VEAYVDSIAVLWELTPDVRVQGFGIAFALYGSVGVGRTLGTLADGGAFEGNFVSVVTTARGLVTRIEFFEVEDLDAALARFAELRPDPLRIPPNAAARAMDRWTEAPDAAPCVFDDRRAAPGVADGDGSAESRTLLATAGDRLALEHVRWTGSGEALRPVEVDAEGRILATILFDAGDRRAASEELSRRLLRGDARSWRPVLVEVQRGLVERDLARIRTALSDDFVFHDHRRTGPGLIEGADGYVAWLRALLDESPDAMFEPLYDVVAAEHGTVNVGHTIGTLRDGGAFDSAWVMLATCRGDRMERLELFEPDDLDVARARFAERAP
jgi:ketosteroid isomerase-like protein